MAADFGGIARGPGAFDQGTTGMRIAGLGKTALLTPGPTGIFRGREPESMHELAGGLEAREVAQFGHHGHCHRALDRAQGLQGLNGRRPAPGVHLLVERECETPQPCRLGRHGLDVFLKDDLLRQCGTHHLAAPSQVGGTPVGPPGRADIVPQSAGLETQRGRLQIPEGIFPCPTQVAARFIRDGRDRDGREVPGAHAPSQWHGVTPVGFDAVAGFCGHAGRSDDPTEVAFVEQVAIEPGAAGTGLVDANKLLALGLRRPDELVEITLPRSDSTEGDDCCTRVLGHVGDRERVVNIRLTHLKTSAAAHHVIMALGVIGQEAPATLAAGSDPVGQANAARTLLAASGSGHGPSV
jgi:hypothetical protein